MPQNFVIQEHHAATHHFDLRLEHEGLPRSWSVPRGLPLAPGEKRLAIEVEDHGLAYGVFHGGPAGGKEQGETVRIWDDGTYEPRAWADRKIVFDLHGQRLHGAYSLVKLGKGASKRWIVYRNVEDGWWPDRNG